MLNHVAWILIVLALGFPAARAETLRFAGTTPPLTFDPHSSNDFVTVALIRQVYDSLVGLAPEMELTPALATKWEYRGANTWRFTLRGDVKFHDGAAMTTDDVAFSIMRQKASPLYAALFGGITTATAIGQEAVDVVTATPDPILPRKMTRLFVISQAWARAHEIEKAPTLGNQSGEAFSLRHANGTGPMQLDSHLPNQRTEFSRNPTFWGAYPGNIDRAIYTPIGSAPTRIAALLSHEVDLVTEVPNQDVARITTTAGFKIAQGLQQLFMELEMDGTRDIALDVYDKSRAPLHANPFKDVRVRQAIAYAVSADLLVKRVLLGQGRTIGAIGGQGFGGYQPDLDVLHPTDVARAKALLAEAGYRDGFATKLNCPLERYPAADEVCRAIASMLARIGIDVRVNGMVWADFARMLVNGPSSSFHFIGGSGNSGDIQEAFVAIMATRDRAKNRGMLNWAMWTDPAFDAVTDELVQSFDPARRTALYRAGIQIGRDKVHAVYLYQPMISWAMRAELDAKVRADTVVMLQNITLRH